MASSTSQSDQATSLFCSQFNLSKVNRMSQSQTKANKNAWKQEAAKKKLQKEAMRQADKLKTLESKKTEQGKEKEKQQKKNIPQKQQQIVEPKQEAVSALEGQKEQIKNQPELHKNPIFQLHPPHPLLGPISLTPMGLLGEKEHAQNFNNFSLKIGSSHQLINNYLAQIVGKLDVLVIASGHSIFRSLQLKSTVISANSQHSSISKNFILVENVYPFVQSASKVLIGASALVTSGRFLCQKGSRTLSKLCQFYEKQLIVLAQTYKLSNCKSLSIEGLQSLESCQCSRLVTEVGLWSCSNLHGLWEECK